MKTFLVVLGSLLLLAGVVWILQGIGLLPGSFMTGQMFWAAMGAGLACVGVALLLVSRRFARRG